MNFVHLVLITKYRRGAISKNILKRIEELTKETCIQMQSELLEFNGEHDHVHLLVSVHPKYSVANFVGKIKGKTSYFVRKEFWNEIKDKLWGDHFWSPSYCVVSAGGAPLEVIKEYIENQRAPTSEKNISRSKKMSRKKEK